MKITSRASTSNVHSFTRNGDTVLIRRSKFPVFALAYNLKTQEHVIIECDPISKEKIDAAVTKALAWAKHNIKQ